uniref:Uncharacterized protein n=1 Tax=Anguilla anguilla TaxID=7936 RepID=A0A0E9WJN8_ANGAN
MLTLNRINMFFNRISTAFQFQINSFQSFSVS